MHDEFKREFEQDRHYDRDALSQYVRTKILFLNQQQKTVYDSLIIAVNDHYGGIFFPNASGGTGNLFFISILVISLNLASIRTQS